MKMADNNIHEKYSSYMEDQREFFDEPITKEWDSYLDSSWDLLRKFVIDRLFERVSPQRIIDLGCGCGYYDILMAQKNGVREIVGIDYSRASIEKANEFYSHPKACRYATDIFELQPNNFDMAVSFHVIEHLNDAPAFLKASAWQVKSGGWVVVVTTNKKSLSYYIWKLFGRKPPTKDPWHFCEYTVKELMQMGGEIDIFYESSFCYSINLVLPKTTRRLIPHRIALSLGYCFPTLTDYICVIFRTS